MRRGLLTILIFLLAGAAVNVGVAWIGAWEYSRSFGWVTEPLSEKEAREIWSRYARPGWPSSYVSAYRNIGLLGTYDSVSHYAKLSTSFYQIILAEQGWPLRSLRGTRLYYPGGSILISGIEFRRVPSVKVRPIVLGFMVNTLFYAALLWLLIPGPFALRRLIRRRRGLCPACGYDLRHAEHEACPECGLAA